MKTIQTVDLKAVRDIYSGTEGAVWALFLGEQLHLGGLQSSMDLAEKAGIGAGMKGVDLCCGNGAGMRVLVRFREVAQMVGVELTEESVDLGRQLCAAEGLSEQIELKMGDASDTGLPAASADFVWGEDAWCYVIDKAKLVAEAARLVKPGGTIAFTDWIEGEVPLSEEEATRIQTFMKFPNIQTIDGYKELLSNNNCDVIAAEDTGRFVPCMDLYQNMSIMQFGYDIFKATGFNETLIATMTMETAFLRQCAQEKKIAQGLFVGRKGAG